MKKSILGVMIALFLVSISSLSFAASYGKSAGASYMIVEGTIVSIDKAKHLFAIKDKDDGTIYGLSAWPSDMDSLNQGDNVKVTVPLPGSLVSRISK